MSSTKTMSDHVDSLGRGIIGAVFTSDNTLHCVLGIDPDSSMVELSCYKDQQTSTIHMPLAEVVLRMSEAA